MVFEKVKNFLTINLVEGSPLNELGNNLLIPGLFLWGGRSVKILNTKEIQQQNIPSILERKWRNPIVWVQTAFAIIVVIPCTILAVGTKWIAFNCDLDLKGMYEWTFYNLRQKIKEESIDDYCRLNPKYFTEALTTKEKFLSATAEKPLLKTILSFHLSEEQIKNWELEEETSCLVQQLSEEDLRKSLDYFFKKQIIINLFERVPHEKIFSLVKDPRWKEVLLCTVPNKKEILDEFVRYLQPEDSLNFFNPGLVPSRVSSKILDVNLCAFYPDRLLPYMIRTITVDEVKNRPSIFKSILEYFYRDLILIRSPEINLLNPITYDAILPDHFIFILRDHSPQLAFLIYPLKKLIISEVARDLFDHYPSQTNINYSSIMESICSFETFVKWVKYEEVDGNSILPKAVQLHENRVNWVRREIDIALTDRGVNVDTNLLYYSAPERISAFFQFLEALFKSDLSEDYPIIINRYLKKEDRKLVLGALCNEESTYKIPSLFDINLRRIFESKIPRKGLPQELVDQLELLDLLEGEQKV